MIDPTTQLAAMIRTQFDAQLRAHAQARGMAARETPVDQRPTGPDSNEPGPDPAGSTDVQIRQMVALRVRALSSEDPQRQRKAFRVFLESVLMHTFGHERIDGVAFDQMVDVVLQRMEADEELHAALREAGQLLLAESTPTARAKR